MTHIVVHEEGDIEAKAVDEVPKVMNKWLPVVEAKLPETGFVNGLEFPTAADLAVPGWELRASYTYLYI